MLLKKTIPTQPEGYCQVWLNPRVFAKISPEDFDEIDSHLWRLRKSSHCFYAVRRLHINGKIKELLMHRVIAQTPIGFDCHHVNHNTLDNRRENLENLSPTEHQLIHKGF